MSWDLAIWDKRMVWYLAVAVAILTFRMVYGVKSIAVRFGVADLV
jgi:hypothetical protein